MPVCSLSAITQQIEAKPPGLSGHRYEPRPIHFLGASTTPAGRHVKSYAIMAAGHGDKLPEAGIEASWQALTAALPACPTARDSHGVAILTMHLGLQGFWVLIDWWANDDVLMHRHLHAPVDRPAELRDAATEGFGPCVWELAVQAHEHRAWLQHVLANPNGPNMREYLEDGLTAVM